MKYLNTLTGARPKNLIYQRILKGPSGRCSLTHRSKILDEVRDPVSDRVLSLRYLIRDITEEAKWNISVSD